MEESIKNMIYIVLLSRVTSSVPQQCPLLLLFNFHEGFYSNNHGSDHPFHGSLTDGILRENNIPDKHHVDLWYSKRA